MRRTIAGARAPVTGASSGIGRQIALELARQGAVVLAMARRETMLRDLVAEAAGASRVTSGRIETLVGDVTDDGDRGRAVAFAAERLGGLDILVNNAGVGALGPFSEAEPSRLRTVMEVNFFALAEMTRAALPLLKAGRKPIIVNVGSVLGHIGMGRMSEYCASKFAVQGLSKALRAELAHDGVDVLVVSPGLTESEFFDHLIGRQGQPAWRASRPVSAAAVARRTVRAIRRGRREVFPNLSAKFVHWANRLAPSLLERVIARRQ